MDIKAISYKKGKVKIIDQSLLPERIKYVYLDNLKDLSRAVKELRVRGVPALGAAGALGVYLGVKDFEGLDLKKFKFKLKRVAKHILLLRPTAKNLSWGVERAYLAGLKVKSRNLNDIKEAILEEALRVIADDRRSCESIGINGADLIKDKSAILTICNAGSLATCAEGTALSVLYAAKKRGKVFKVYASETRPLLQGSRLTSWELMNNGIDTVIICDNTAGALLKEGKVSSVIVGADRIALNGDMANKIGTYNLALLCKHHKVPFYVAAPLSTFDLSLKNGRSILIEQRDNREVSTLLFKRKVAPKGIKVFNPAFDITDSSFITAIITDKGIIRNPYRKNIKKILC
jgi:methylthioribose-1-phosphate isomerase